MEPELSTPEITGIRLNNTDPSQPQPKDVLVVGAGLGTGVYGLWHETATALAEEFQVIGWDLPGHDGAAPHNQPTSIADLAQAVVDLVDQEREAGVITEDAKVFYAGVSINGEVALQLALEHADHFDGVAVICSAAKIGETQAWNERGALVEQAGTPTQIVGSGQRWFAPDFIENNNTSATNLLHVLQEADRFSYARLCEALGSFDVRDRLGEITVPVLTIHGAHDAVCTPEAGTEIIDGVAKPLGAEVLDNVAHQAPVEDPKAVAQLLAQYFVGANTAENPVGHDMSKTSQEVYDAGMAVRREVLGASHVDRAESAKDETTEDFQNLISRYAWGTIWTRPGLDRKMRSAVTISAMVSGGYWDECAMHIRAALRNGLSRDEIKEILLQTAIYSSVPAANIAFKLAQKVFAEVDADLAAGKDL